MLQTLRRAGGSLIMTVPKSFIEQNGLTEGAQVGLHLAGKTMTVRVQERPRYKLSDLISEMGDELPLAEGWESMPAVGLERF